MPRIHCLHLACSEKQWRNLDLLQLSCPAIFRGFSYRNIYLPFFFPHVLYLFVKFLTSSLSLLYISFTSVNVSMESHSFFFHSHFILVHLNSLRTAFLYLSKCAFPGFPLPFCQWLTQFLVKEDIRVQTCFQNDFVRKTIQIEHEKI